MHTGKIEPREPAGEGGRGPIDLPVVIRPEPLRLVDIEWRVRGDTDLAAQLRERPDFCAVLARALFLRDRQARLRFVDAPSLALHLQSLVAG